MSQTRADAAMRPSAAGETTQPWLRLLRASALVITIATVAAILPAGLISGLNAVYSVLAAAALVVVFFGITLLIGHFVGLRHPRAALGAFMAGYLVKVVGFGAVVFLMGTPDWLVREWFLGAAVGAVIVWQATEMVVFSRFRFQLYDDGASAGERGAHGTV
ncbi:hypothetical protein [Zhihengliuella flava]|uniref:ATP synthase protein I n=1 Tax=Zhihengliuella flava TaxID=1285193 RepID=A0A931D3C4_9MICC|nr:hypothetical protein [Zhihengliuella flava]MBG6083639.1 ATP synthase protein I [Zhihengliuella flava]